ncbi:hypothetical protein LTR37_018188 [Vermiconidia calcicola]|uniref:Uncharacterized protein n=1 Tax=Vermiconidia calcicola TaxID=1690605 RepID=A0ACC3MHY2_9PEZI|nr:hypothetical protein LTR37_018188 [Vermiconidia calcicola]
MALNKLVLVTGGSGFVGSHCIIAALHAGYRVRTTVRSLKREDEVRQMLKLGGATEDQAKSVEFCAADLTKDDGWPEACRECAYVLHVASPFPPTIPKSADDLIIPAREGTLRALRAAKSAGTVKRVVVTSSIAAVAYGHQQREKPFTEEDWTNLEDPSVPPYPRSKTIAEQAAWDWIAKEGGEMELSVVNPGGVFGPILSKTYSTSIELVVRLMNGQVPGLPNLGFSLVDVRDVADLHLMAMTDPKAAGQRYLCITDDGFVWTKDIALKIKNRLGDKAKKIPTMVVPGFVLRLVGLFDKTVASVVPELNKVKNMTNEKARTELGWRPRNAEDALVATAESLEQFGLLK